MNSVSLKDHGFLKINIMPKLQHGVGQKGAVLTLFLHLLKIIDIKYNTWNNVRYTTVILCGLGQRKVCGKRQ